MKVLILFSFLLALTYADHYKVVVHDDLPSPRIGPKGEVIQEIIEGIRDELKQKHNGIIDNKKISINLTEQNIQADITATGNVKDLLNFDVTIKKKSFPIHLAPYTYNLLWKNIDIDISAYDLKGYVHLIQIYGKGKLRLNIKDLVVNGEFHGKIELGQRAISIKIVKLTTEIKMGEGFSFEITGWLNDEVRSRILTAIITNNFPKIMKDYKTQIDKMVEDTLFNLIKDITIPLPI